MIDLIAGDVAAEIVGGARIIEVGGGVKLKGWW
jgi:hypothetical protein